MTDALGRYPHLRPAAEAALVILVIGVIGWFDYVTGPEIAFSIFYLLPIALAAWRLGSFPAWCAALLAAVSWFLADIAWYGTGHSVSIWNAFTRLVMFSAVVAWMTAVRTRRARERREALQTVQATQARFRDLVESTSDWVWEVDRDARYTYCSPKSHDLLGYRAEELIGRTPFELMPEAEAGRIREIFDRVSAERRPLVRLENINLHKAGHEVVLETSGVPIFDANRNFCGYRGIDRDITERKRAEEERIRLSAAVEQSRELVVITNIAGDIVYVNAAFEQITGYPREEILGRNPRVLKSGRHTAEFYREMWEALALGHTWRQLFVNRRKDGTLYDQEATIFPVRDLAGRLTNYVCTGRDVTRERRLAAQLGQAQRLEAVGRLAGGVAHDFNNLLTVILASAGFVLGSLPDDHPARGDAEEIRKAAQRAAHLTKQLLLFGRHQVPERRLVDLNTVASDMHQLLVRLLGEQVQLRTTLAPNIGAVRANPSQIEQILVNLAANARDAMPAGGTLTIETADLDLDETDAGAQPGVAGGRYIMLAVTDTGAGMDADTKAHLFEPFFTTKPKGNGLGLATVYGIVRQTGGHIGVYSELNEGTTFKIYLPRAAEVPHSTVPAEDRGDSPRGRESVLLVEDQETVRAILARFLSELGYKVRDTGQPEEALRLFSEGSELFDLLLTDVVMPGMSGPTLAARLNELRPDLKVIYVSGYADVAVREKLGPHAAFLQKPFSRDALAQTVRHVLDSGRQAPSG